MPLHDSTSSLIDFTADVRCYNFKAFDTQIGFPSHDQRLYIPFLLRSDPNPEGISESYEVCQYVERLLEKIQGDPLYSGYERTEDSYGIGEEMQSLRSFYRVRPKSYQYLVQSRELARFNCRIPRWIYEDYKTGNFDNLMMNVLVNGGAWRYACVVENTKRSSAWAVASKPRRYILGALSELLSDPSNIWEIVRSGVPCALIFSKVQLKDKHSEIISGSLHDLKNPMTPADGETEPWNSLKNRQKTLLKCFNCKHIQSSLGSKIPDEFKLAVVACRSWLKTNGQELEPLVAPLVFCILSCSGRYPMPENIQSSERYDLDLLHSFAQWQCLLHHAIALNQLLACPFQYTSPARLFSCAVVEHFCLHPPPQPFEELPSLMISVVAIQ